MSELRICGVTKSFGEQRALTEIELQVHSGVIACVLGPSGCGKTTLLRIVAGFDHADAGTISIDDTLVASQSHHTPPERRRVGIVPQEGALFPHMNVAGNVSYGLTRARRRDDRISEVLDLVGLIGLEKRMPHELSGGQQQRVALARALAPKPALILMDEPFSALDAPLRVEMRTDVSAALRADGATAVFVTHDQAEALSIADQVAVMRTGRIVQVDTPARLYQRPHDIHVAQFVGEAVVLHGQVNAGVAITSIGEIPVTRPDGSRAPDGTAHVVLRPEQIAIVDGNDLCATVVGREYYGHDVMLHLALPNGYRLSARILADNDQPLGATVGLHVHGPALAY